MAQHPKFHIYRKEICRDRNGYREEDLHVAVRDAGDGRFAPGVRVIATLIDADGDEVGTHEQPLLWHPMIYHYGRNWAVPSDGEYTLRVRVEPPTFMRHNGDRCRPRPICARP